MARGYVLGPDAAVDPGDPALKASASSTGGALTLYASRTDGGAPPHVHEREDECFYVVEGEITVTCGEEEWRAGSRSFVFLPRGIPHAWDVVGTEALVLIMTIPGGFEEFMRAFHEAAPDERARVAARHGIRML